MLTLRALNDTKSAFVGVEFRDQYFDSFQLSAQLRSFSCKVNVKVCSPLICWSENRMTDCQTSFYFSPYASSFEV